MAHELDFSNGRANMAYVGKVPWHELGHALPGNADLKTWRKAAGLDWSVKATPVLYRAQRRAGGVRMIPDHRLLLRSDTRAPLGIVSRRYKVVHPGEVLSFFEELVNGNGFTMETAGSLRGGKRIWALARVGEDAHIVNGDNVRPYLLLATSYDASMATTAQFTSIRVVCNNTLTAAVGDHGSRGRTYEPRVTIRHIREFNAKEVREQLSIATSSWEEFILKTRQMAAVKVNDDLMDVFLLDLYQVTRDDERAIDKARKSKAYTRITQLFKGEAMGAEMVGKTLWGAVNAVTEYVDHERGNKRETALDAAWFGEGAALKNRALSMAQELLEAR